MKGARLHQLWLSRVVPLTIALLFASSSPRLVASAFVITESSAVTSPAVASVTSPAPARSAAVAHSRPAPRMPGMPPMISTWPRRPL